MEYENNYSIVEKLCYALAWTAQRLRQYILHLTTRLIAKLDHINYLCEALALSRKLAEWQVLLFEYGIMYVNQKTIKGSEM